MKMISKYKKNENKQINLSTRPLDSAIIFVVYKLVLKK